MQINHMLFVFLCAISMIGCGEKDEENTTNTTPSRTPSLALSITSYSFAEPVDGSVDVEIEIALDALSSVDASVDYQFTSISAIEGVDYVGGTGTLLFPPGTVSKKLSLTIIGDDLDEENEELLLNFSNPSNIILASDAIIDIAIVDEDPTPTVGFETEISHVIEGIGLYSVIVKLSSKSQKDIEFGYEISGLASVEQDYNIISEDMLMIKAGTLTTSIDIDFVPDELDESGESLIFKLHTPSSGDLGEIKQTAVIILGNVTMNDTGLTTYFDGDTFTNQSATSDYPNQDALYGRDSKFLGDHNGKSGFDFVKIDYSGNELPMTATSYSCIRDNTTGLVWEKKSDSSSIALPDLFGEELRLHLQNLIQLAQNPESENYAPYPYNELHQNWRDSNYKYYYYEPDPTLNGGSAGAKGQTFVNAKYPISSKCSFPNENMSSYNGDITECNSNEYVEALNSAGYCGFKNWKTPTIGQLQSFHNFNANNNESAFFVNTQDGRYLSSTPSADGEAAVWCFDHKTGQQKFCNKQTPNYLRLVREDK